MTQKFNKFLPILDQKKSIWNKKFENLPHTHENDSRGKRPIWFKRAWVSAPTRVLAEGVRDRRGAAARPAEVGYPVQARPLCGYRRRNRRRTTCACRVLWILGRAVSWRGCGGGSGAAADVLPAHRTHSFWLDRISTGNGSLTRSCRGQRPSSLLCIKKAALEVTKLSCLLFFTSCDPPWFTESDIKPHKGLSNDLGSIGIGLKDLTYDWIGVST